jgi:hypothetical protein
MAHTIVMVPEGHTVQVHPPGAIPQPAMQTGMISNPANEGAKASMDAALPVPAEQKAAPVAKAQPARKKKPADKADGKQQARNEGDGGKIKTPR